MMSPRHAAMYSMPFADAVGEVSSRSVDDRRTQYFSTTGEWHGAFWNPEGESLMYSPSPREDWCGYSSNRGGDKCSWSPMSCGDRCDYTLSPRGDACRASPGRAGDMRTFSPSPKSDMSMHSESRELRGGDVAASPEDASCYSMPSPNLDAGSCWAHPSQPLQRVDPAAVVVEHVSPLKVARIGLGFDSVPPSPLVVSHVKPGTWAAEVGIEVGDEVLEVNRSLVVAMKPIEFRDAMLKRPLRLKIARRRLLRSQSVRTSRCRNIFQTARRAPLPKGDPKYAFPPLPPQAWHGGREQGACESAGLGMLHYAPGQAGCGMLDPPDCMLERSKRRGGMSPIGVRLATSFGNAGSNSSGSPLAHRHNWDAEVRQTPSESGDVEPSIDLEGPPIAAPPLRSTGCTSLQKVQRMEHEEKLEGLLDSVRDRMLARRPDPAYGAPPPLRVARPALAAVTSKGMSAEEVLVDDQKRAVMAQKRYERRKERAIREVQARCRGVVARLRRKKQLAEERRTQLRLHSERKRTQQEEAIMEIQRRMRGIIGRMKFSWMRKRDDLMKRFWAEQRRREEELERRRQEEAAAARKEEARRKLHEHFQSPEYLEAIRFVQGRLRGLISRGLRFRLRRQPVDEKDRQVQINRLLEQAEPWHEQGRQRIAAAKQAEEKERLREIWSMEGVKIVQAHMRGILARQFRTEKAHLRAEADALRRRAAVAIQRRLRGMSERKRFVSLRTAEGSKTSAVMLLQARLRGMLARGYRLRARREQRDAKVVEDRVSRLKDQAEMSHEVGRKRRAEREYCELEQACLIIQARIRGTRVNEEVAAAKERQLRRLELDEALCELQARMRGLLARQLRSRLEDARDHERRHLEHAEALERKRREAEDAEKEAERHEAELLRRELEAQEEVKRQKEAEDICLLHERVRQTLDEQFVRRLQPVLWEAVNKYGGGVDGLRTTMRFYDKDRKGALTEKEFTQFVRKKLKISAGHLQDGDIQTVFVALDGDGNGDLSPEELLLFMQHGADAFDASALVRERARGTSQRPEIAGDVNQYGSPLLDVAEDINAFEEGEYATLIRRADAREKIRAFDEDSDGVWSGDESADSGIGDGQHEAFEDQMAHQQLFAALRDNHTGVVLREEYSTFQVHRDRGEYMACESDTDTSRVVDTSVDDYLTRQELLRLVAHDHQEEWIDDAISSNCGAGSGLNALTGGTFCSTTASRRMWTTAEGSIGEPLLVGSSPYLDAVAASPRDWSEVRHVASSRGGSGNIGHAAASSQPGWLASPSSGEDWTECRQFGEAPASSLAGSRDGPRQQYGQRSMEGLGFGGELDGIMQRLWPIANKASDRPELIDRILPVAATSLDAATSHRVAARKEQKASNAAVFDAFDRNHDGVIDRMEWDAAMSSGMPFAVNANAKAAAKPSEHELWTRSARASWAFPE